MKGMLFMLPAVLCGAATLLAQEVTPSEQRDVGGDWVLNAELSDDLPLLPGEAMATARASGVVRAQGQARSGGAGPDHQRIVKVRMALRHSLESAERMTILDSGNRVVLTDDSGSTFSVVLDNRKHVLEQQGLRVELRARWDAPLLVLERRYEDGTTVIDAYVTFSKPRQLVGTTTIHNGRTREPPVTMRRVYDAVVK